MRSHEEIAQEALRRAALMKERREAKKRSLYAAYLAVACLALTIALAFILPTMNASIATPEGVYGAAMFVENRTGGYALIGIIGFALGAAVTLYSVHKLKKG